MDRVKGHPLTSLPGLYPTRNRAVRIEFDALEQEFETETPEVVRQALTVEHPDSTASILDEFTRRCVHKVLAVLQELLPNSTARPLHAGR
jgi:hypothetical protein